MYDYSVAILILTGMRLRPQVPGLPLNASYKTSNIRARVNNSAQNLSILRRMILNTLKQDTSCKASLQRKRKRAGWSDESLITLLALLFKF